MVYGQDVRLVPRQQGTSHLRASDADRERVVDVLREAAADGRLTIEEHSERMERAYASRTFGELAELTADLIADSADQPLRADTGPVLAVFGSQERKGRWVVPSALPVTAVMGEVTLDLREALLEQREITITATAVLGEVKLIVPEGVDVRMSGPAILGAKTSRLRGQLPPGSPVVNVRCFVALGEISAKPPRRKRWYDKLLEP